MASWWGHTSAARPPRTDPLASGMLYTLKVRARAAQIAEGCGVTARACHRSRPQGEAALVQRAGRPYVLKKIACRNVNQANQALLEAACLQRLRHPGVVSEVSVFTLCSSSQLRYLAAPAAWCAWTTSSCPNPTPSPDRKPNAKPNPSPNPNPVPSPAPSAGPVRRRLPPQGRAPQHAQRKACP